jgi:hypothetical protein
MVVTTLLSEAAKPIKNSYRPASSFGTVGKNTEKPRNREEKYCCGGAEESTGGDGTRMLRWCTL